MGGILVVTTQIFKEIILMKSTGIKDVMTKTKTVAAATTLMAGLGVATNVHADDVTTPSQPETQVNQDKATVTQADVESSKATLDNANQAVSAQEQVVKEAATTADNAQAAYDQAKENTSDAQDLVNQATPENIVAATDDVTTAENQVTTAENLQEQAETTQSTAETAIANQTQTVSQAQDQVTTSQAAVDAAQKDVNDKQAILDGTGQAEIIANRDKAQADINSAQNQVDQAEADLAKAEKADANRQTAIVNAQKAVDAANQTVTSTKSDLDAKTAQANQTQATEDTKQAVVDQAQKDVNEKQAILDGTGSQEVINEQGAAQADKETKEAAVTTAEANLTKAQQADKDREIAIQTAQAQVNSTTQAVNTTKAELDTKQGQATTATQALETAKAGYTKAENDYNSINTIQLSQPYIEALIRYTKYYFSETEYKASKDILKIESEKLYHQNVYKPNLNDDSTTKYDVNNLPENVKKEISLFASDLINQIRTRFGAPETVVTTSSIKFADLVTSGYVADHWSVVAAQQAGAVGHDAKAVNEAASYFGLPASSPEEESQGWQYYEDWAGNIDYAKVQSIADLKRNVYDSIKQFMFDSYEWLHAASISSSSSRIFKVQDGEQTYLAVEPSDTGARLRGFHFLLIDSHYVARATKKNFDTTPLPNPNSSDKIIAAYKTAKSAYDLAKANAETANQNLAAAQSAYDLAVTDFNTAQEELNKDQVVPVQTPAAQANLVAAETAYSTAKERLVKAQKAVDALNADIKAKQAALTYAKATLEATQSALAQAQAENSVAQEAKVAAQTAYDNAVSNLLSASKALTQAQSVAIQMPTAQANLASAQATLKQAQEDLVKAQKAVDALSADIKVKQANLASAKQVLSTKQATLATKQAILTTEQNRLASLQNSLITTQANVLKAKENVITAKDNLVKAQTYLTSLQNAPALLVQAQQQEATAKANLLAALDTLEAELLKLKDLQVKQAAAQAVYDTTSKAYQTMLDAQEKQRLKDEYNAIIAQGKTPVAIVDETGKIIGYHIAIPQTVVALPTTAQVVSKASKAVETPTVTPQSSALPTTGDSKSVLTIISGGLLTLFGLIGVRKKETK